MAYRPHPRKAWGGGPRPQGDWPDGVWAAHVLNLTTQLPAVPELVTSGPIPTGVRGVLVHRRNNVARLDLNYAEIAVLEALRDWSYTTEANWNGVVAAVRERV